MMHEDDTMDTDDTDSNAIAGERSCKSHTSGMMHENEQCKHAGTVAKPGGRTFRLPRVARRCVFSLQARAMELVS